MSPVTDDMTKQEVIEELARALAKIIRRELAKKNQNQKDSIKVQSNLIDHKNSNTLLNGSNNIQ